MNTDTAQDNKACWRIVRTQVPWEGQGVRLHQNMDRPLDQDQPCTFAYLESAPAVVIVPVTASGDLVL